MAARAVKLLGEGRSWLAITPDGTTAYVANLGSGDVTPIDTATNTAQPPIALAGGAQPLGLAITPDGTTAYVGSLGSGEVTPIDIATNTAGPPILAGADSYGIAITPDGATAYVASQVSNEVTPIDTATNTAGTPIAVGSQPVGIAITPDQAPIAAFAAATARVGSATGFDAGASSDPDGSVARYDWDFGDGSSSTSTSSPTVSHAYARAGSYTATLTVTDDEGCSTRFIFTGQTASCTGSSAARVQHQVTVSKATVSLSTSASAPITLGGEVHDTATLTGGQRPTGQIAFSLYGPDDANCSRAPVFTNTITVAGGGDYRSASFRPARAGTYRWTAAYSGDADNEAASSACNAARESMTVSPSPRSSRLLLTAPRIVIAQRSFHATCRASRGGLRSCRVEARRGHAGSRSSVLATGRASRADGAGRIRVALHLSSAGRRRLAGALAGVRATLRARAVTPDGKVLRAKRSVRLFARTQHVEPKGAMFGLNRSRLTDAGRSFLRRVRERTRSVGSVRCEGHTASVLDGPRSTAFARALSVTRADVACRYLRQLGLRARYRSVGFGSRDPRASNRTARGRARNRYVGLTITHSP